MSRVFFHIKTRFSRISHRLFFLPFSVLVFLARQSAAYSPFKKGARGGLHLGSRPSSVSRVRGPPKSATDFKNISRFTNSN